MNEIHNQLLSFIASGKLNKTESECSHCGYFGYMIYLDDGDISCPVCSDGTSSPNEHKIADILNYFNMSNEDFVEYLLGIFHAMYFLYEEQCREIIESIDLKSIDKKLRELPENKRKFLAIAIMCELLME